MSNLVFQIISLSSSLAVLAFVGYYFFKLHTKEKELEEKTGKMDSQYHLVIDNALARERKIIEDATKEADQIITNAHYISENSKKAVDQALQKMVIDIQNGALSTSRDFMNIYQTSLKQLTIQSLNDFQTVSHGLETDLQKQIKDFRETLLPNLEKELEDYKQTRLKEVEEIIAKVVQKVSQEVLNKSLSLSDHEDLVIESLEKAKKEGILN